ncbi:MAG: hypothetical protein Q9159_007416 [Coniocarpon cinnabarinum]
MTAATTQTQALNEHNVIHLVPEVDDHLARAHQRQDSSHNDLDGYDEEQIRLMDEVCIVLDENDKPIGSASHLMTNIDKGLLHRAFSVFLFDQQNRLLVQQRATEKITFPDLWTNTCCSHPLGVPSETGAELEAAVRGVKSAARRKLNHELNIPPEQVPLDEFSFLGRIHYKAPSGEDGKWGEHEIDYILIIKPSVQPSVTVRPNVNEVRDCRYVSQDELKSMFKDEQYHFTPWFKLICSSMLFEWWDALATGHLDQYIGNNKINRML